MGLSIPPAIYPVRKQECKQARMDRASMNVVFLLSPVRTMRRRVLVLVLITLILEDTEVKHVVFNRSRLKNHTCAVCIRL